MKNTATIVLSVGAIGLLVWYLLRHAATSPTTVAGALIPPPVGFTPDVNAGTKSLVQVDNVSQIKQPVAPIAVENPISVSQLPVLGIPARLPVRTAFPASGAITTGASSFRFASFVKAVA